VIPPLVGCPTGSSLHLYKEKRMYAYTIYRMHPSGQKEKLDYVVCTGNETLASINERAEARLQEIRKGSKDPDSISMERRLVPGI